MHLTYTAVGFANREDVIYYLIFKITKKTLHFQKTNLPDTCGEQIHYEELFFSLNQMFANEDESSGLY